jgi:hypothetical protein
MHSSTHDEWTGLGNSSLPPAFTKEEFRAVYETLDEIDQALRFVAAAVASSRLIRTSATTFCARSGRDDRRHVRGVGYRHTL